MIAVILRKIDDQPFQLYWQNDTHLQISVDPDEMAPSGGCWGGYGFAQSPLPLPILWKWNNLDSVRPNYFIFMGYLKKLNKISKANPQHIYTYEPFPKFLDPMDRSSKTKKKWE